MAAIQSKSHVTSFGKEAERLAFNSAPAKRDAGSQDYVAD